MYFSGKAELTAGEMRDAGKRGPEAGGGAKGSEGEVVGLVHIFSLFLSSKKNKMGVVLSFRWEKKESGIGEIMMVQLGLLYRVTMGANFNCYYLFSAMYH